MHGLQVMGYGWRVTALYAGAGSNPLPATRYPLPATRYPLPVTPFPAN
jgi:hypothetical protein